MNIKLSFILLITTVQLTAQPIKYNYLNEWKNIDTLIYKNNATKTALQKVEALYKRAKKDKAHDEVIKSLLYKIELTKFLKENSTALAIQDLQQEINSTTNSVARSLLHLIQAKQYINYYLNNNYNIKQRSTTNEKKQNRYGFVERN
jgi:hypothetical protein